MAEYTLPSEVVARKRHIAELRAKRGYRKKTIAPGSSIAFPPMKDPIGAINPALAKSDPAVSISSTPFGPYGVTRFYSKSAVPWKRNASAYPNQSHLDNLRRWASGKGEYGVVVASINGRLVLVPYHAAKTAERAGADVTIYSFAGYTWELMAGARTVSAIAAP